LEAVVIESSRDAAQGVGASVIVREGTLRVRQDIFTSETSGRVRGIFNDLQKSIEELRPGEPGQVFGFKEAPVVGSVVTEHEVAATVTALEEKPEFDFGVLDEKPKLKFILKADTLGTLEAISQNFDPESIDLISSGVGEVTDAEVELAKTTGAKILAVQVKVAPRIANLAKSQEVKIKSYEVIYQLIEYIQKRMLKLLEPTIDEVVTGEAEILQIFEMKGMKIAGIKVISGEIGKNDKLHLWREGKNIIDPVIASMMHGKQEISSIKSGNEGGVVFKQKRLDFTVGDRLKAYVVDD
jgi:translation initiation factor IF-2